MKNLFTIAIIFIASSIVGCDPKKDDSNKSDNELITMVSLVLHNSDNTRFDSTKGIWSDVDGPGGNNPIQPDTLRFKKSNNYSCHIYFHCFQNGVNNNITPTIEAESMNHLICYDIQTSAVPPSGLIIERTDKDKNGYEVGLTTLWKTNTIEKGTIKVRLKHQPNIKNGTCDPGETDVEVDFPFVITN